MANQHISIATLKDPEFLNLQPLDINPLMSSCDIKVLYTGLNRNHTLVSKEKACEIAKTLRGCPIVGYYKKEKEDFRDHGNLMSIDEEGIHFTCKTIPYGFVSPDAKVWFQEFEDTLPDGTTVVREYLMTTGYLWTGQYEECKQVIEEGKGQSMEFDENSFEGQWTKNYNNNMEFFIINDATFSKLCILGDDIEPCFEGANITSSDISKTFTKNENNFVQTLYTMMQDLKEALEKGGKNMENEKTPITENGEVATTFTATSAETKDTTNLTTVENQSSGATSYVEKDEKKKEEEPKEQENNTEKDKADKEEKPEKTDSKEKEEDEEKKKYSLLEQKFNELETKYSSLEKEYQTLVEFKNKVDEKAKLDKINEFTMLTDEDKKDVMENLQKYTLEEIESKLSVTCFHKKVNFNLEDNQKNNNNIDEQKLVAYSLTQDNSSLPDWVKAVKNNE